jgi:hypothetical protein
MNNLQNLKKVKGVTIQYVEYLVRNMVGFLYYVKYKESNKTYLLLASKRFILQSLNLDNYCVKLLCYHSMGNVNGMAEMLTLMNSFITENKFTTQSSCVYLNMFAYCQIKARHNKQSVKNILQSLCIFPSRYNAASGYLKIVLQILNSLYVSNC